jgi:hypothetical protein
MDIGSILILFALLLLVGLYIARPILEGKSSSTVNSEEHDRSALLAERDRMINALQELEFDYALGKIPEGDYPVQRAQMLHYGAEILRKLDAHSPPSPGAAQKEKVSAEDRLEAAIVRRRKAQSAATAAGAPSANGENGNGAPDDNLEVMIAQRRRERQGKSAGFCHQCGSPLQQSDRFCPRCGLKIY